MIREMKNSGVEWIGDIPSEWRIGRVKNAFTRKNEKAHQEEPTILSLARSGVKIRDLSTGEGQIAESYYNYNPVEPFDLLLNPMDLYSGANCSISKVYGVISPAYINLKANKNYYHVFYDYYFKTQYWAMAFFAHGKGVSYDNRWTLSTETLMNYYIPVPSLHEQKKIADFLDSKVTQIDKIISETKASIENYKEYKQSVITEAVTKGLDKNVPMKDSGVEWIGDIPSEWEIIKLKKTFSFGKGLPITKENLIESGIPVISYGQIHSKKNTGTSVNEHLIRYVEDTYVNTNPNSLVSTGDIIFADTSEDLDGCGNCVYVDVDYPLFAGYHTIILRSSQDDNKYYSYLFKTDCWRSQIRSRVTGIKLFSVTQKY